MSGYYFALLSGVFAGVTVAVGKMATGTMSSSLYVLVMSLLALAMTLVSEIVLGIFSGRNSKEFSNSKINSIKLLLHNVLKLPQSSVAMPLLWHVMFSAVAMWTFWEGTKHMEAAIASFSVRIELIFVLIASRIVFKEKLTFGVIVGAFFVVVGTGIMGSNSEDFFSILNHFRNSTGLWLMIVSGASFAGAECFANILASRIAPTSLVIWRSIWLSLIFSCVAAIDGDLLMPSKANIFIIGLAALFGPVLARICFMFALRKIDLGKASLLSQTEPVVTAIVAWFLLGEKLRPLDIFGALAILIGCIAISARGPATSLRSD